MVYISWDELYNPYYLENHNFWEPSLKRELNPEVVNACREVVYHPKPKKSLEDWM